MRRLTSITVAFAILLSASPAWAFYATPSSLLDALQSKGGPRNFNFELHGNLEEQLYFSAWVKGAHEGRTSQNTKAKVNVTFDIADDDTSMRMRFKMLAYQGMFYFMLEGSDLWGPGIGSIGPDLPEGKWFAMPLTDEFFPDDTSNFFIR